MKHLRSTFFIVAALLAVLAACAPQSTPVVVVVTATTAPADTATTGPAEPTATEPPTATATLVTINLLPPMKVGSTFIYADLSTLVAVPNEGPLPVGKKGGTDNPETTITLSDFWIYRAKVTNQQYKRCVAAHLCTEPNLDDNQGYNDVYRVNDPVVGVTWAQADAYCKYVRGHLPTEWQTEKTGRGPLANLYSWGGGAPSCERLNFNNCVGKTTDVNTYALSESYYKAYDMQGNTFEWQGDKYEALYYRTMPTLDPPGPDTGITRAVRSSSYKSNSDQVALYTRFYDDPTHHRRDLGFRCVVDDPAVFAPACEQIAFVGPNAPGGGQSPVVVPTPSCPPVGGSSSGFCNNNVPGGEPAANLHFSPNPLPPGTYTDVPAGCSGGPNDYYCNVSPGGIAHIQAQCTIPPPPVPAGCSAGYTETPPGSGHCVWTGGGTTGTECLPGDTYDPVNQCCSSTPGAGSSYNLCPSEAPYYAGGICVPWPSADKGPLIPITVSLGACNPGGGGPCTVPTNPGCTYPWVWDGKCGCTCSWGAGKCT